MHASSIRLAEDWSTENRFSSRFKRATRGHDCIAITGKQIAPSISQIAGSENEISQSGLLLVCATSVSIARTHTHTVRVHARAGEHLSWFEVEGRKGEINEVNR